MRVLFLISLFFAAPLIWDAYSSASANRGVPAPEVLPAMKIQIRLGGTVSDNPPKKRMNPGDTLYFKEGSPSE